ncbi:hypothetical protein DSECCO2_436060 [anaerobic digester metagenome]
MQNHVHERNPDHSRVKIKAVECVLVQLIPCVLLGYMVSDKAVPVPFLVFCHHIGTCVLFEDIPVSSKQETGSPARRVADPVIDIRVYKLDYHPDYVPWSPELPVLACGCELA